MMIPRKVEYRYKVEDKLEDERQDKELCRVRSAKCVHAHVIRRLIKR